jgi:hypothetical protein
MANSGSRSGEDRVEGEPGGEAEARGRRGCQGEPLRGLTRWRGMVWPGKWEWSARPRGRTRSDRGGISTMSRPAEPDRSCGMVTQTNPSHCTLRNGGRGSSSKCPSHRRKYNLMQEGVGSSWHEPGTWLVLCWLLRISSVRQVAGPNTPSGCLSTSTALRIH